MRNGWNWKYPLSYMYPAHTQLLAKCSSPSIGDRRATGWLFLNLELTKYSVGFRATLEQTLLSSEEKNIRTMIFFNSDHYEDPQVQFNWDDDDSVDKQHRQRNQSHNGDDDNNDNSQSLPARQSECLCLQVSWSSLHWKNDHVHWTGNNQMKELTMTRRRKEGRKVLFVWL